MRLKNHRAIITGAGSGIGRAVVSRFIAEGARVIAVVRNPNDVPGLESEGAICVIGDVKIYDFHKRLEKQTPEELEAGFHDIFGVNVLGAMFGARAAIAALRASGGAFIATGSNACFLAGGGGALYTASKFALRGLVLQLAKEFAPDVRVNGVAPGATDTALSGPEALGQGEKELNADPERVARMAPHIPLGRVSAPEDHTSLFVLLAAKTESPYITGTMMLSDGGLTISV
jgi:NAD(P)-dependent dehydrogenase (short-subunit alcohol dehydrogenase family)